MTPQRLLVVDACMNKRLATELSRRGRDARSTSRLLLHRVDDEPLLRELHELEGDWILVSSDDHMPEEHAEIIQEIRPTLALIDPVIPDGYDSEDNYECDVVHKWAHRMQEQEAGSIYRYNVRGRQVWKKPRRSRVARRAEKPALVVETA